MVLQTLHILPCFRVCSLPRRLLQFTKDQEGKFTTVLVYVDVMVLARNDLVEITKLKQYLHSHFHMKDLRDLIFFDFGDCKV